VTGDVTPEYLDAIEQAREGKISAAKDDGGDSRQLHLNLDSVH
jgi:amidophosphoribosyltransferase